MSLDLKVAIDFWVGEWKVVIATREALGSEEWVQTRGSNRVTSVLNGCAIREDFTAEGTPSSWSGTSLSMWRPMEKRWRQTWADDSGNFANGEMMLRRRVDLSRVGGPRPPRRQ